MNGFVPLTTSKTAGGTDKGLGTPGASARSSTKSGLESQITGDSDQVTISTWWTFRPQTESAIAKEHPEHGTADRGHKRAEQCKGIDAA